MSRLYRVHRRVVGLSIGIVLAFTGALRAGVLTLDQCIDIALEHSPSMANARYSLGLARQNVWSAWGDWLPQFSASAGYGYNEQGGVSTYQFSNRIVRSFSKSIGVQQSLFNWGGEWFNIKNRLLLRRSSEHRLTQSELETIDQIKNLYFGGLKAKGLLEVSEQAVAAAEENLKLVQARFDLGSANQSELLKAKVQLLFNRSALEQARRNLAVTLAQLNNAMNRPATTLIELDSRFDTLSVNVDYDAAMAFARAHHPQVLAAEAELQAARYQRLAVRSSFLPSISWDVRRSYSVRAGGHWGSFSKDISNTSFGMSLGWSIPFLDGFSRKTSHARATAAYKLAQIEQESTVNGVGLAVQTALLDINNARANLALYEESLRSAEEDLQIAQERYNLGAATILDLLDAEKNLADARQQSVSAKFDFNLAVAALDKAMGKRQ